MTTGKFIGTVLAGMLGLAQAQNMGHMNMTAVDSPPTLRFSADQHMNAMLGGGSLRLSAAPGMGRYTYRVRGHRATISYATRNARGLFNFYDKALWAEGWKEDRSMAMGMMHGGYMESYVMGKGKLDLSVMSSGNQTVVSVKTH